MDDDDGKLKKTLEVEGASRSVADPRRRGGGEEEVFSARVNLEPFHPPSTERGRLRMKGSDCM